MNRTTWIIVAHRGGAEIFKTNGRASTPKKLRTIDHPAGRLKAGEINTDGPGRTFQSAGPGQHRLVPAQRATERVAEDFARSVTGMLDKQRVRKTFDALILVAPPRFLGRLREAFPAPMRSMVVASLGKDLAGVDEKGLAKHLAFLENP
jgi:protein required for attachment to host cells